jgi:vacuolar-type H+-ATPase subunit H
MSFLNNISEWFNNSVIQSTYNPVADELKQLYRSNVTQNLNTLQTTVANIGGGLGNAILAIPGVGPSVQQGLIALQKESEELLKKASTMTPDQIASANDSINQKYQKLLAEAQAQGTAPPPSQLQEAEVTVKSFFSKVFSNILYICLFFLVLALALVGSSFAANAAYANIKTRNKAYIIYYMIYGFILFPLSIIFGFRHYLMGTLKFFAVWAPLIQGYSSNKLLNLLIFPFVYNPEGLQNVSKFTRTSMLAPQFQQLQQLPQQLPPQLQQLEQQLPQLSPQLQQLEQQLPPQLQQLEQQLPPQLQQLEQQLPPQLPQLPPQLPQVPPQLLTELNDEVTLPQGRFRNSAMNNSRVAPIPQRIRTG